MKTNEIVVGRDGIKYIKVKDLILGRKYKVDARNFSEATWNGSGFIGLRTKFGSTFEDEELHYDDDPHYGTCKPLEIIE
jgi:hypothetical protein